MLKKSLLRQAVFICFFLLLFYQRALAYLDPGTGSYVLQVLLAVLFGALFMIKAFWENVKAFIKGLFSKKEKHDNPSE